METMERCRRLDRSIRQVVRNFDLTETVLRARIDRPNHHIEWSTSGDGGLGLMTDEHMPVPCNG
jgi:hypothetical protein